MPIGHTDTPSRYLPMPDLALMSDQAAAEYWITRVDLH
jgi:hypothetical protein